MGSCFCVILNFYSNVYVRTFQNSMDRFTKLSITYSPFFINSTKVMTPLADTFQG